MNQGVSMTKRLDNETKVRFMIYNLNFVVCCPIVRKAFLSKSNSDILFSKKLRTFQFRLQSAEIQVLKVKNKSDLLYIIHILLNVTEVIYLPFCLPYQR